KLGVVVFVEVVHARLPLERARRLRFQADFLRELAERGNAVRRLAGKRNEPRTIRQTAETAAPAAVDVATTVRIQRFVTGDRIQRHLAEIPLQLDIAAED